MNCLQPVLFSHDLTCFTKRTSRVPHTSCLGVLEWRPGWYPGDGTLSTHITQSGLSNDAIPSVRLGRRKWLCLRFLLSPHWSRTVQLFRDCSLLAVTGGAQKSPQTDHMRELVEVVERGWKGGQKLKIVASRAEVEDAPGTCRERWGCWGELRQRPVAWGFTGAPGLVLSPPGPFAALSTRLSQCSCTLPQPKKFVGLGGRLAFSTHSTPFGLWSPSELYS